VSEPDIPAEVQRMAERRAEARLARDFATADALREEIHRAGFEVTDGPSGSVLSARPNRVGTRDRVPRAEEVESLLGRPPACDAIVEWVAEGWPEDTIRGIESFDLRRGEHTVRHVVVDLLETGVDWPRDVDIVRLPPEVGWARARNAGLARSSGEVVIVADGSIEATGDVLGPLIDALQDQTVGVTGPFGIRTHDLHDFHESAGPEVDAVEGYLMAFRRELVCDGLRFDEKFRFYRTADIELSFQVKALGLRATVTPVPVHRHEHRMWANTADVERTRLSKRNFYRFLDRWRGRTDLLVEPHAHDA
jgi:cysteinyl-tRNA synthetase